MPLASGDVEAWEVEANLAQIERDILRESQLVGGVGQDRVVDHLRIAVALRLHGRSTQTKLGVLVSAKMVLQYFRPGCVEASWRTGFSTVLGGVCPHAATRA